MLLPIELSEAALHFGSSLYLHHSTTFIVVQIKRYHLGIKITFMIATAYLFSGFRAIFTFCQ